MAVFDKIKKDFPAVNQKINGKPVTFLDSGASSIKPLSVIKKMDEYYTLYGVNIFRGVYSLSERATKEYENVRKLVAEVIG